MFCEFKIVVFAKPGEISSFDFEMGKNIYIDKICKLEIKRRKLISNMICVFYLFYYLMSM